MEEKKCQNSSVLWKGDLRYGNCKIKYHENYVWGKSKELGTEDKKEIILNSNTRFTTHPFKYLGWSVLIFVRIIRTIMIFWDVYFYINDLNCQPFGKGWTEKVRNLVLMCNEREERMCLHVCEIVVDIHTLVKKRTRGGIGGNISSAELMVLSMIHLKCHCTDSNHIVIWLKGSPVTVVEEKHQGSELIYWNMRSFHHWNGSHHCLFLNEDQNMVAQACLGGFYSPEFPNVKCKLLVVLNLDSVFCLYFSVNKDRKRRAVFFLVKSSTSTVYQCVFSLSIVSDSSLAEGEYKLLDSLIYSLVSCISVTPFQLYYVP